MRLIEVGCACLLLCASFCHFQTILKTATRQALQQACRSARSSKQLPSCCLGDMVPLLSWMMLKQFWSFRERQCADKNPLELSAFLTQVLQGCSWSLILERHGLNEVALSAVQLGSFTVTCIWSQYSTLLYLPLSKNLIQWHFSTAEALNLQGFVAKHT